MRVGRWLPAAAVASATTLFRKTTPPVAPAALLLVADTAKRSTRRSTTVLTRATRRAMSSTSITTVAVPLIDVDCNLWHKDLASLQQKSTTSPSEESSSVPAPLSILTEDAIEETNIVAVVSPSSTLQEAKMGLEVLQQSKNKPLLEVGIALPHVDILTTVGVHPYHVNDDNKDDDDEDVESCRRLQPTIATIQELVERHSPLVCAIGECGLDGSDGFPPVDDQVPWFQAQVQVAMECRKPLFVHERLAFAQTMDILEPCSVPIIIHCFTGTPDECQRYVERGYSLSISGLVLKDNDNGQDVRTCLQEGLIPLGKLMIETDAPYMGFDGCRRHYLEKNANYAASLNSKKRKRLEKSIYPNVPSSLAIVLEEVLVCINAGRAKRGEDLLARNDLARITTENAIRFFGFPDSILR